MYNNDFWPDCVLCYIDLDGFVVPIDESMDIEELEVRRHNICSDEKLLRQLIDQAGLEIDCRSAPWSTDYIY